VEQVKLHVLRLADQLLPCFVYRSFVSQITKMFFFPFAAECYQLTVATETILAALRLTQMAEPSAATCDTAVASLNSSSVVY
jgi:hypothetical protein